MIKYLKLTFLVLFFTGTLIAQQSAVYTHDLKDFNRGVELYKEKQYQAAQILFDKVKATTHNVEVESDCAYYIANCAIRLNQMGADVLIEKFIKNYPTSTKTNLAYIEVAHYYFDAGNYKEAAKSVNKVRDFVIDVLAPILGGDVYNLIDSNNLAPIGNRWFKNVGRGLFMGDVFPMSKKNIDLYNETVDINKTLVAQGVLGTLKDLVADVEASSRS